MVRPRKGMNVMSPHLSELLWSCRRQEDLQCAVWKRDRVFIPWEEGAGDAGGCSWTRISIHCKCWLHDEQDCHGKCCMRLMVDGATWNVTSQHISHALQDIPDRADWDCSMSPSTINNSSLPCSISVPYGGPFGYWGLMGMQGEYPLQPWNHRIIWLERTYKIIMSNPSPSYVKATTVSLSVTSTHLSNTSWDDDSHTSHLSDSFFKCTKKPPDLPSRDVSFSNCSYKQPMLEGYQGLCPWNCPSSWFLMIVSEIR